MDIIYLNIMDENISAFAGVSYCHTDIALPFPDMNDPGAWYYLDMTEAANSHNYTVSDGAEKWK